MDFKGNFKFVKGLSLVELIVALGISSFLFLIIAAVYVAHSKLFSNQNTFIEVATQNKIALEEMTNQIREGHQVATSCCGDEETSSTVLILQLWSLDAGGEPTEATYDYIVYKRDEANNTKLIKKIVADAGSNRESSEKILATNISDLQFSYDPNQSNATAITISLKTTGTANSRTFTNTQSSKAVLRNK